MVSNGISIDPTASLCHSRHSKLKYLKTYEKCICCAFVQRLVGMRPPTQQLEVLKGLNGVLQPGRLTLLLGPPACGKTTLLKVLGGRRPAAGHLDTSGEVK